MIFKLFDRDSSGEIGTSELGDAMAEMGMAKMDPQQLSDLMAHADVSGDGQLSFDEFFKILQMSGGNQNGNETNYQNGPNITDKRPTTSSDNVIRLVWMPKMWRLVLMSGMGNSILRSMRPGLSKAGSRDSMQFVAMITLTSPRTSKPSSWLSSSSMVRCGNEHIANAMNMGHHHAYIQ